MKLEAIIYFLILIIGVIIGVLKYKHLLLPAKILFYLIVFIFLKEAIAFTISFFGYNLSFYQYLSLIDFVIIAVMLLNTKELKKDRWYILSIICIIFVFYFVNLLVWQPPGKKIDSNFKLLKSFFLVSFSLILYRRLLEFPSDNILTKSLFWIGSGILIFNVINIFYWGVFNYYIGDKNSVLIQIRPFFNIANYIMYSFFSIAIFFNRFSNAQKVSI